MSGRWQVFVPTDGRPLTSNQLRRLHWAVENSLRGRYRDDTFFLAKQAAVPRLERVQIIARGEYADGKELPDTDAIAPAVKGCVDGLVMGRIIPDDSGKHLARISSDPPIRASLTGIRLLIIAEPILAHTWQREGAVK